MRAIESKIIKIIKSLYAPSNCFNRSNNHHVELENLFDTLQTEPYGTASIKFLLNPDIKKYIEYSYNPTLQYWYMLHTESIENIERYILQMLEGKINPDYIFSRELIKNVYLSNNHKLIDVLARLLPIPSPSLFDSSPLPKLVENKKQAFTSTLKTYQEKHPLSTIQKATVTIQRKIRGKQRYSKELVRISDMYTKYGANFSTEQAKMAIKDANTPYKPKCKDIKLRGRILRAVYSDGFELFDSVKHITSGKALLSIFNDALYGNRNLVHHYLSFRPAALHVTDVLEGDGNVICFGPNEIDPIALQDNSVEIKFDLKKIISARNAANFYKQKDFGFETRTIHSIPTKKELANDAKTEDSSLVNTHFTLTEYTDTGVTSFKFIVSLNQKKEIIHRSVVKNSSLISYNHESIHQILTLNFFRFIDNLKDPEIINNFYAELNLLNDEELVAALKSIGQKASGTAEFNFSGAYQLDFSSIISFAYYSKTDSKPYILLMSDLISSLKANNLNMLNTAKQHMPQLFKSYKFLDYLISHTPQQESQITHHPAQEHRTLRGNWFFNCSLSTRALAPSDYQPSAYERLCSLREACHTDSYYQPSVF